METETIWAGIERATPMTETEAIEAAIRAIHDAGFEATGFDVEETNGNNIIGHLECDVGLWRQLETARHIDIAGHGVRITAEMP